MGVAKTQRGKIRKGPKKKVGAVTLVVPPIESGLLIPVPAVALIFRWKWKRRVGTRGVFSRIVIFLFFIPDRGKAMACRPRLLT